MTQRTSLSAFAHPYQQSLANGSDGLGQGRHRAANITLATMWTVIACRLVAIGRGLAWRL